MPIAGQCHSFSNSLLNRRGFLTSSAALLAAATSGLGCAAMAEVPSLGDTPELGEPNGSAVFGSTEVASRSFRVLPQWSRVLGQMRLDGPRLERCGLDLKDCDKSATAAWNQVIAEAKFLDRAQQVNSVNSFFNRWPYKLDQDLYGVSEYWASPLEFLQRSGDCEDYSIAKFFALRQLGIGNDQLRVVILFDRIRNIGHAVLAVYEGPEIFILDSLSDVVLPHWKYKHYQPQYSMNETTRWAHLLA